MMDKVVRQRMDMSD